MCRWQYYSDVRHVADIGGGVDGGVAKETEQYDISIEKIELWSRMRCSGSLQGSSGVALWLDDACNVEYQEGLRF